MVGTLLFAAVITPLFLFFLASFVNIEGRPGSVA
jgi:hypothetical protein